MGGPASGNVPVPPTSLLGRDELLQSIVEDLASHRLVTLTGVGGVGKTRLATEIATTTGQAFPDGVWMVALGTIDDPSAVVDAVATALGIAPQGDRPLLETVAATLAGRPLLLVLDNCEHVLAASIDLVSALLGRPGELRVLATSRRGLRTAGEREVVVPPLTLDGGSSSPAVRLFTERAQRVRPNFAITDDPTGGDGVIEICRVLDGLPLGIELAAARMAGMGVVDVRDRLGDRFRLLQGAPDAPERHQSLPELVRWSFELLEPEEREVLQRTAVFTGGFDLATYVDVYDVGDDVAVLRTIDRLVRSSLVIADHDEGRVRYRLLETIRQFGLDRLDDSSSLEACLDRHARSFARRGAAQWERWNGPEWRAVVDWFLAELANLRAAFRWSADRDVEVAADLAAHAALIGTSANVFEPIAWAEQVIERASHADIARLPRLHAAAGYACFVGRPAIAAFHADRAIELESEPGYDPCPPGLSAFIGALANVYAGDLDRYVELAGLAAEAPGAAQAFARPALVDGLQSAGRVDEALELVDDSVAAARAVGSPFWIVYALWIVGDDAVEGGSRSSAVDVGRGGRRRRGARHRLLPGLPVPGRGPTAPHRRQSGCRPGHVRVRDRHVPPVRQRRPARHHPGQPARAVRPTRCARCLRPRSTPRRTKLPASAEHVPDLASLGDRLVDALGDAGGEAFAAGAEMDLDHAAAFARTQIRSIRQERAGSSPAWPPGGLTRRELEVLRLVTEGLTTREVGERLFISAKTADRHIQNIYTKIGTSTRATATRWAVDHGVHHRAE